MWETLRKEEVLKALNSNRKNGLNKEDIYLRKQKYGKNKLQDKPKETLLVKFIYIFLNIIFIISLITNKR